MQEKRFKAAGNSIKSALARIPRWMKWILLVLLVLSSAGGALAMRSQNTALPVESSTIAIQNIERNVFANGRLESMNEQTFFAPVDSTLMELKVKLGDQVKKGDVLGRLDSLELARRYQNAVAILSGKESELAKAQSINDQMGLKVAEAEFNKAQNNYNRAEQLFEAGAISVQDLESARVDLTRADSSYQEAKVRASQDSSGKQNFSLQSQVELAKQEVAQAKERLDMATFSAQVDGVVTSVGAKQGNRVMEGTELLVISDNRSLEVTTNISEIDAGNLRIGQSVELSSVALPGQTFCGAVSRIGGAAVVQKSTNGENINVPVTISLNGDIGELKIGYSVDLTIKVSEDIDVIALPINAILERNGNTLVFIIKGMTLEERLVELKRSNELYDIVIFGVNSGEEVVLNPKPEFKNGQKVKVTTGVPK
jgi:HlyD family secretion protein